MAIRRAGGQEEQEVDEGRRVPELVPESQGAFRGRRADRQGYVVLICAARVLLPPFMRGVVLQPPALGPHKTARGSEILYISAYSMRDEDHKNGIQSARHAAMA